MQSNVEIQPFFDPATFTLTYLVFDPKTHDALVIDSVLDYEPQSSTTATTSLEALANAIDTRGLKLHYALETHAHADHLSGAQWLKSRYGARVVIGDRITAVQETFAPVFDMGPEVPVDGSQFDVLLADGAELHAGSITVRAIATPGHTPACMSYLVGDAVFTGDALFMEDYGVGRCDFPKGDAGALYHSVHERLYGLPDATRVFVGHDYQPGGRPVRWQTTIGASKEMNIQLRQSTGEGDFVAMRKKRDATLQAPRLLWQSVQVNIDAGRLPDERRNGRRYLTIPLNLKKATQRDGAAK